ncbi:MAG: trehalose-6-phosphate synthase [Anaerolineae bacterium]|nr:trehalose-6-phosphate synthase [Anaerolineae bacterium]
MNLKTTGTDPLIVIVSNRGPFSFTAKPNGEFDIERGAGGLVTALGALAEKHEVLWIASTMSKDDILWAKQHGKEIQKVEGIYLRLVRPNKVAYEKYYGIIANPLLWFIQHQLWDAPRTPSITEEIWDSWNKGYLPINKLLAKIVIDSLQGVERPIIILPQDYHLYLIPYYLRKGLGDNVQIQPFVHIPWPGPNAWRILPKTMRDTLLLSLLQSNRIGFQTKQDSFNFVQTCRFHLPDAHSRGKRDTIYIDGREIASRPYPISVDVEKIEVLAEDTMTRLLKSEFINFVGDQKMILRVDRIEPSKNIIRGLETFKALLEKHPEYHEKVKLICLLVPSRMEVTEYQDYLKEIMAEAGMINAEFSQPLWEPVRVILGDNYMRAIAAMQLYDVLFVNPIADGMNLVAKEGALLNQKDGVLVLSEYAGAYYELGDQALTVSPYDIYGTVEAIHRALQMPLEEKQTRANALREIVRSADIKDWFQAQVQDALEDMELKE